MTILIDHVFRSLAVRRKIEIITRLGGKTVLYRFHRQSQV